MSGSDATSPLPVRQAISVQIGSIRLTARRRKSRKIFHPTLHVGDGRYRLPYAVVDLLAPRLQGYRNAEAAFRLAVFLGRNHAGRGKSPELAFYVARRSAVRKDGQATGGLADCELLGLTEGQIRGAIKTLEEVGFLVRFVGSGNGRQRTGQGVRMAPIRFQFGREFYDLFSAARKLFERRKRDRTSSPRDPDFVGTDRYGRANSQPSVSVPTEAVRTASVASGKSVDWHDVAEGSEEWVSLYGTRSKRFDFVVNGRGYRRVPGPGPKVMHPVAPKGLPERDTAPAPAFLSSSNNAELGKHHRPYKPLQELLDRLEAEGLRVVPSRKTGGSDER